MIKYSYGVLIIIINLHWEINNKVLYSFILGKQFAYENNILSQLDLDHFACGGNFAVGVTNGITSHEKVLRNSQIKDFVNER